MPTPRPQCTSSPGIDGSMKASGSGLVDGLFKLAGSRSTVSTHWLNSAMAMKHISRLAMVSLTSRFSRSQPTMPIQKPPIAAPASAINGQTISAGIDAGANTLPNAAAASPPSTNAPSAPMMTRPACAGSATARPVSIKGAARCRVFCQAKASPKPPCTIRLHTSSGSKPASATAPENSSTVMSSAAAAGSSASASAFRRSDKGTASLGAAMAGGAASVFMPIPPPRSTGATQSHQAAAAEPAPPGRWRRPLGGAPKALRGGSYHPGMEPSTPSTR